MKVNASPGPERVRFLDEKECGARYGFSARHWRRLADSGQAPRPVRFGRLVRWAIEDLIRWESDGCQASNGRRSSK
jgi:predicted DNA-binding transcriptional regulator AlpA